LFVTNGSTTTVILKTNHVQHTCFITSQQSWVEKKLSKQVQRQHALNNFNGCHIGLRFLQNCIIWRTTWTYCCRPSALVMRRTSLRCYGSVQTAKAWWKYKSLSEYPCSNSCLILAVSSSSSDFLFVFSSKVFWSKLW
jgi:hypothetical protein